MQTSKFKIIFFDCDGVLIFGDPWVRLHKAIGMPEELDEKWYWDYYNGKWDFRTWNQNLEDYYKLKGLHETLYDTVMQQYTINPETKEILPFIKQLHIPLAIISSGTNTYVSQVAKKLKFDYWRANSTFEFDENGLFTRLISFDEDPKAKPRQIQEICDERGVDPKETMFVGDSINDLQAFKVTKHGVLYRPEKEEYKQHAWKVIRHLVEIKSLIST